MSSNNHKLPYEVAFPIALKLWENIKPYCPKGYCKIAGSIRRSQNLIGDIEIVCVPNSSPYEVNGLFGKIQQGTIRSIELVKYLSQYTLLKGNLLSGKYVQLQLPTIKADIFFVEPESFGYQLLIRTGPWQFSKKMVTRLKDYGYKGKDGKILDKHDTKVSCIDENAFFDLVRMPFVKPSNRK